MLGGSQKNLPAYIAFSICCLWFGLNITALSHPWFSGYDSSIRLYYKHLLVVVPNWPPLPQLYLRFLAFINDNLIVFKFGTAAVSLTAMYLLFLCIAKRFGINEAILTASFFFVSQGWIVISTEPYAEALLYACIFAALYFYSYNQKWASILFLVLATFTKNEVLLSAPALVLSLLILGWKLRAILHFCCIFLPSLFYNLAVLSLGIRTDTSRKVSLHFLPELDLNTAQKLLAEMFLPLYTSTFYRAVLYCAIIGIILYAISQNNAYSRRFLVASVIYYVGTLLMYTVVAPIFHGFTSGGDIRKVMFAWLPIFFFAALGIGSLMRAIKRPSMGLVASIALFSLFVIFFGEQRAHRLHSPPEPYSLVQELQRYIKGKWPERQAPLLLCDLDPAYAPKRPPGPRPQYFLVQFYLRYADLNKESIPCLKDSGEWQIIAKERARPLLRLYRVKSIDKGYLHILTASCERFFKFGDSDGKEWVSFCL